MMNVWRGRAWSCVSIISAALPANTTLREN